MRARTAGSPRKKEPAQTPEFDLILLGAGAGSRFGSPDKLFRQIGSTSLISHCVGFWSRIPSLSSIIVTVPNKGRTPKGLLRMIGVHDKKVSVVRGGATRQESVFNALKGVATEIVVIHDGARPTLHPDDVAALLSALGDREAVTLGTPARDTLVRAPSGVFTEVVPRDSVWQIFTPQGFRAATIRDAHEWARAYGAAFTDDFTLACLFTNKSRIIETRRFYLKVTYPEDEEVWRKFANPSE